MAIPLRADTQVKVVIGPFVDKTDGLTPETAVTITGGADPADEAEALKYDNATTVDISSNTWAALTGVDGYYHLTLTTGNTDTEGYLVVVVQNDSLHLPVRNEFVVLNANVYDSLYAVATTDYLQVDMLQVGGDSQSGTDLKDFADAGYDPATNKVQGVVLVDTTTTNTDMLTAAAVNAEVVDALNTDTYAEPGQATPGATVTLVAKIGYLYKNWRNKKTETATQWNLYNDDAATIDQKAVVSDDGTTTTKGEMSTGA